MKKNTKGLSTIVSTLIIILLVLVAIGVIWSVLNNFLDEGQGTIETGTKCLSIDIKATKVINTTATSYNVTLSRKSTGEGEFGAKIVFFSDEGNSEPMDFGEMLSVLETNTQDIDAGLEYANKIELTPYYLDESGNVKLCQVPSEFSF